MDAVNHTSGLPNETCFSREGANPNHQFSTEVADAFVGRKRWFAAAYDTDELTGGQGQSFVLTTALFA